MNSGTYGKKRKKTSALARDIDRLLSDLDPALIGPDHGDAPQPAIASIRKTVCAADGPVRPKTITASPLSSDERLFGTLIPYPEDVERPKVRSDCANMPRPCPFVSCIHHLYLDVNPATGDIKLNFPHLEVWEMEDTCALDVADRGGITLEEVGAILNLTRERIRQVEVRGLYKIRVNRGEDLGIPARESARASVSTGAQMEQQPSVVAADITPTSRHRSAFQGSAMKQGSRRPSEMTPDEFECFVRDELERLGHELKSFKVSGKRLIAGLDGDYEIDASVRFEVFRAEFRVAVECKRYRTPVKRDLVMTLHRKVDSLGFHKGMMFATSGYQSGAIEYAERHGIALFHVQDGSTATLAKFEDNTMADGQHVSWLVSPENRLRLLSPDNGSLLKEIFAEEAFKLEAISTGFGSTATLSFHARGSRPRTSYIKELAGLLYEDEAVVDFTVAGRRLSVTVRAASDQEKESVKARLLKAISGIHSEVDEGTDLDE